MGHGWRPPALVFNPTASSRRLRLSILRERDGDRCALCGGRVDFKQRGEDHPGRPTIDHVIPQGAGGSDNLDNLQIAHRKCNIARGNMAMEKWWERLVDFVPL